MIRGQINLHDRWSGRLEHIDPASGKRRAPGKNPAALIVRTRGWHQSESHLRIDGKAISASLFDFGLYFFHNAKLALEQGSGAYFCLPKIESHLEARLWNSVFVLAQSRLGLPIGTIKATVLIETLPAAFEMDEIIYELRDHLVALGCDRSDYIFSFIKVFAAGRKCQLPDRRTAALANSGALAAHGALLIQTCHRRAVLALGNMATQIPNRRNYLANEELRHEVRAEKEQEARSGHDGGWLAHLGMVPVALEVFDELMPTANQLYVKRDDVTVGRQQLLALPKGNSTEAGLRETIRIGVQCIAARLCGCGTAAVGNFLEDAASAEASRALVWLWLKNGAKLASGRKLTRKVFAACLAQELQQIKTEIGELAFTQGRHNEAAKIFVSLATARSFQPFLVLPVLPALRQPAA